MTKACSLLRRSGIAIWRTSVPLGLVYRSWIGDTAPRWARSGQADHVEDGASPPLSVPASEHIAGNRLAFAIWDRFPGSRGHALVVPRRLITWWWEATEEERRDLVTLIDEVRSVIKRRFAPDGGFNSGAAAGQTVSHFHLHVIPHYAGDVEDPRGGIRHVIPGKGNYLASARTAADTRERGGGHAV